MTNEETKLKELYFSDLDRELDALRESVMKSTETFKKDCIEVMNFYKTVPYAVGVGYSTKEVLYNIKECQEMTDEEIIKALEQCLITKDQYCITCPFSRETSEDNIPFYCTLKMKRSAADLINRQQAEIEKLKEALHECHKHEVIDYMR